MHNCRDPRPADTEDRILIVVGRAIWRGPFPRLGIGLLVLSVFEQPVALSDDVATAVFFVVHMNAPLWLDATRIDPGTIEPHFERGDKQ